MAGIQHGGIVDRGERCPACMDWFRSLLVPQWWQSSRIDTSTRSMENVRTDLLACPDRQCCVGNIWKRETKGIYPRVGSRNPCRTLNDFHIGDGLIRHHCRRGLSGQLAKHRDYTYCHEMVLPSVFCRGGFLLPLLDRFNRFRNRNPSAGSDGGQGNCHVGSAAFLHLGSTRDVPIP